jgi:hypothetical protein
MGMNKIITATVTLLVANLGCASERLYVKIIDDNGYPVTNAVVTVGVPPKTAFWGSNSQRRKGSSYHAQADTNGEAVVSFNCVAANFRWSVKADGYYPSNVFEEWFTDFDEVVVPPAFTKVILHEHEKHGNVILYRKKNPQPMYAYTREMNVKSPVANGRYGFDLECFDWLPPHGNGKVADFYYVRERPDETNMTVKAKWEKSSYFLFKNGEPGYPKLGEVVGRIEFDKNCGAYVGKQTGCTSFPSLYRADPNQEFFQSFPITIRGNGGYTFWLEESDVVNGGEYMVIRSRVKCDENGNIVSANYSKILGTMRLDGGVGVEETVFNPCPNDTNLEFDPKRNLYHGKEGRGMIP